MFSVELLPDSEIELAVRDDWNRLIEAGLPSSGRNPSPSSHPHVTLAARDRVEAAAVAGIAGLLPVPLELGGVLLFGHGRHLVLSRQIVVTAALLAVHREVARTLGPPEARYANTGIDRWTPHVTLASGVRPETLPLVLKAIAAPHMIGAAVGLRVWDASAKVVTTLL